MSLLDQDAAATVVSQRLFQEFITESCATLNTAYGVFENTSLNMSIPYRSVESDELGFDEVGFADMELGIKQKFMLRDQLKLWAVYGDITARWNTGENDSNYEYGLVVTLLFGSGN